MNRRVLMGAAAGLLVVIAGSVWMAARTPDTVMATKPAAQPANMNAQTAAQRPAPASAPSAASAPPADHATATENLSAEERRKRMAQLRAEMSAMLASGTMVSPQQAMVFVDELERLSPNDADARQYRSLRTMLETTAQIQTLNVELQRLSGSTAPQDVARRQAILAELRELSTRITANASAIQSQVPPASAAGGSR